MILAIIGSRSLNDVNLERYIPGNVTTIVSGGAIGIDTLSEKYADKNNIKKVIVQPDYKKYKKRAPLVRNKKIVDFSDMIIAFWDGKSKGTKQAIDYAYKKGKKIIVHKFIKF